MDLTGGGGSRGSSSGGGCGTEIQRRNRGPFGDSVEDRYADDQFGAAMKMLLFSLFFSVLTPCTWAQIESPQIGIMLDVNGRARPVSGALAAAVVGTPWFDGAVISLACSAEGCVAKTESALFTPAGVVVDAPPGAAIIALDATSPGAAYVYFVESGKLARWTGSQLVPM